jgi:hypothetical protein
MHWLKLLKNNLNQQQFKSKHLQASYLEECSQSLKPFNRAVRMPSGEAIVKAAQYSPY